jgi:hypothetical protein
MWRKLTKTKDLHNKIWSILASRRHVKTASNGVVSRFESQYLKSYSNTCFEVVYIKLKLIFSIGYLKFDIHNLGYQLE